MAPNDDLLARDVAAWRGLVRTGAWAALGGVALIAIQVPIFLIAPPPSTTEAFLALAAEQPVRAALSLDALYIPSNLATYLFYLALAVVLWRANRSAVAVALAFGTLGMAAYLSSPRPLEVLALAGPYERASGAERDVLLAAAEGVLTTWEGTAFTAYYLGNLVTLLILAVLLIRSRVLGPAAGRWALAAALLMAVPSNVGTVGLVLAVASLVPWSVFSLLAARALFQLTRRRPAV